MLARGSEITSPPLSIRLFGRFEVQIHDAPLPRLRSDKVRWLLALLVLRHSPTGIERSLLADMLWPGSVDPGQNLRTSLDDLRKALGREAIRLRINPSQRTLSLDLAGVFVDVIAFDQAIARRDAASLEAAVELHRGPLLEGCSEEWVPGERSGRELAYLGALETLATRALAARDLKKVEAYGRRVVEMDCYRESGWRKVMQALALGGNSAAAQRVYRDLRERLQRENYGEPDRETRDLFEKIRRGEPLVFPGGKATTPKSGGVSSAAEPTGAGAPVMTGENSGAPFSEVAELLLAHVLCLDIVEYSRLPLGEQAKCRSELQEIVRQTPSFQNAEAAQELLRRQTGDGMALVFSRNPLLPVQCSTEIAALLRGHPRLRLRMGLHTGYVYRVEDINKSNDVAGEGINVAQRVMACGDPGHILLSQKIQDLVAAFSREAQLPLIAPVEDLGECDVKHGEVIHLYNLYTETFGNSAVPAAVLEYRAAVDQASSLARVAQASGMAAKVAIVYKRNAHPDSEVLRLLEERLTVRGFQVFIDRHLGSGEDWSREVKAELRGADAVIPLLSSASVHSEMVAYEVQTAYEAAQQHGEKPRLLPVRVQYTEPLPDELVATLGHLNHASWEGPEDDDRLLADVIHALLQPSEPVETDRPWQRERPGGGMPLDSEFYVVRPTDAQFQAAIARRNSIVLVKGARQMGKTSLLGRGLQRAHEAGAQVASTDLQMLNRSDLQSAESLLFALAEWMTNDLKLDVSVREFWNASLGGNSNFHQFLRQQVLGRIPGPVVWGLDEVDRLVACDYANDVFGLFRALHNCRVNDPRGGWSRLTLVMAYATEAHMLITDLNQSPFNVGTRLTLRDFTLEQVAELNARYDAPLRTTAEVERFYHLVAGQPYLVRQGLYTMAEDGLDLETLEAQADREEGLYGDHLRRILITLDDSAQLCEAVREVLRGRPCPAERSFYRLRTAGVLAGEGEATARFRCQLYATYLKRHLL